MGNTPLSRKALRQQQEESTLQKSGTTSRKGKKTASKWEEGFKDFFEVNEENEEEEELENPLSSKQAPTSQKTDDTLRLTKKDMEKLQKELAKLEKREDKKITHKYAKIEKKNKPIRKSRYVEQEKSRERNHTLNVALFIVVLLLGILIYLVLNW